MYYSYQLLKAVFCCHLCLGLPYASHLSTSLYSILHRILEPQGLGVCFLRVPPLPFHPVSSYSL